MNPLSELHISENGSFKNSNEGYNPEVAEQMESFDGTIGGKKYTFSPSLSLHQ